MNTKNNRRRQASKQRIQEVFLHLLQTHELREITVASICKACGLNRSTFYANYNDIYDLADHFREDLEAGVAKLYQAERTQGFNSNDYLKLFQHIQENQLLFRTYFKLGYDSQEQLYMYDTDLARNRFGDQHIDYHIAFFKSGFNAIVKRWLDRGCQETPEEINEVIRTEYQARF